MKGDTKERLDPLFALVSGERVVITKPRRLALVQA